MRHFAIFGTHPELALAELRAVVDNNATLEPMTCATLVEDVAWDGQTLMQRLGGTVKLGDIVATIPTKELTANQLVTWSLERLGIDSTTASTTSLNFGLTVFGSKKFFKLPIEFKRALKSRGISARWVTGKNGAEIAPAAVAKLKLTSEGLDLCLFVVGDVTCVGITTHVQDADAWSLRDYGRPARDEIVGMLPPKLARMMVNLATPAQTLLDPFCGSGTILMEAALAFPHIQIVGSDISATQIANTQKNIAWLIERRIVQPRDAERLKTFVANARHLSKKLAPRSIHAVVTEGHLGPPLRGNESRATLEKNAKEITELWRATLRELRPLLKDHARLVLVWPEFKTAKGTARVDLTQELPQLRYTLISSNTYQRPAQKIRRNIVVLGNTEK